MGCVADTPEVASWFGDDIAFRRDSFDVDLAGLPELTFLLGHVAAGRPAFHGWADVGPCRHRRQGHRRRAAVALPVDRRAGRPAGARRPGVRTPSRQVFTRWDGKGDPRGVGGDRIALTVRLFHLADVVEVLARGRGVDAAVAGRARPAWDDSSTLALVDAFCRRARERRRGGRGSVTSTT